MKPASAVLAMAIVGLGPVSPAVLAQQPPPPAAEPPPCVACHTPRPGPLPGDGRADADRAKPGLRWNVERPPRAPGTDPESICTRPRPPAPVWSAD